MDEGLWDQARDAASFWQLDTTLELLSGATDASRQV